MTSHRQASYDVQPRTQPCHSSSHDTSAYLYQEPVYLQLPPPPSAYAVPQNTLYAYHVPQLSPSHSFGASPASPNLFTPSSRPSSSEMADFFSFAKEHSNKAHKQPLLSTSQPRKTDQKWFVNVEPQDLRNAPEILPSVIPTSNKMRLPSISDMKTFDFLPQPSSEDLSSKRVSFHLLKRAANVGHAGDNMHLFKAPKRPMKTRSLSGLPRLSNFIGEPPVQRTRSEGRLSIKSLTNPEPSKKKKAQVSNSISRPVSATKTYGEIEIGEDNSKEDKSVKTSSKARFFPNFQITKDFIQRNVMRDLELRSKIDMTKEFNEIEITENDVIKFKIYEFLLGYLNLNDSRDEYLKNPGFFKKNSTGCENEFDIRIKLELEGIDLYSFPTEKTVSIYMNAIKPIDSDLDKSRILMLLQVQLDEFFLGQDQKFKNGKGGKKKRRSRAIYSKPRWGVGYEDELTLLELKIDITSETKTDKSLPKI